MSRRKEIESFYKLFYNEYRMPDKLSYIMDVMRSCKNQDQLDATFKWGKTVLGQFNDVIMPNRYLMLKDLLAFSTSHFIKSRSSISSAQ